MLARLFLAAVALLIAPAAIAGPNDLTVVTRDEAQQQAIQVAYSQPFTAATRLAVQQQVWPGGVDTLRTRAKLPDNSWDVVLVDPEELSTGCGEGLFERLDWAAIGGKDHYQPAAVSECGLGAFVVDTVLAWDKDKLPGAPTWADFWDVAKYPGKRGLHKGVRGNLEIALMADGVAPGDVYKTLATSDGVDRAFRKLDQLKPYIVWWSSNAEAAKILASGDVLMTSAPSGPVAALADQQHRNFGLQFSGGLFEMQSWAITKGSRLVRTAEQFLYFIGLPVIEQRLLQHSGDAAMVKGLVDSLPPEVAAVSASNPANLNNGLRIDSNFWRDNATKIRPRFDAWLGH
jgi:putative spermidine/putrescine transport system substrate-binding protein